MLPKKLFIITKQGVLRVRWALCYAPLRADHLLPPVGDSSSQVSVVSGIWACTSAHKVARMHADCFLMARTTVASIRMIDLNIVLKLYSIIYECWNYTPKSPFCFWGGVLFVTSRGVLFFGVLCVCVWCCVLCVGFSKNALIRTSWAVFNNCVRTR